MTDYALNSADYTWKNALLWGYFSEHCKKVAEGNLKDRVVHALIAVVELLPIVGQIASIFEKIITANIDPTPHSHSLHNRNISVNTNQDQKGPTNIPNIPSLNKLLVDSAPKELAEFVSGCASGDDLVEKLKKDPCRLFSIIQNMNVEGNEPLAARLLYRVNPNDLEDPVVKNVETTLRNRGMLNRTCESTISLHVEGSALVEAHKSILALESPYFMPMKGFKEFQDGNIKMEGMGLAPEVYQRVVDYLYLPDEKRKDVVSTVNKELLLQMAQLSSYWGVDELQKLCDDELCNSLGEFNIEKSDMDAWLDQSEIVPKFTKLLGFVNRVAGSGNLEPIISQMQTPGGVAQLAAKCTPEEIEVFATLKTAFGKAFCLPGAGAEFFAVGGKNHAKGYVVEPLFFGVDIPCFYRRSRGQSSNSNLKGYGSN